MEKYSNALPLTTGYAQPACVPAAYSTLEDFCLIKPNDWDCEIILANFDSNDYPKNTIEPIAIVKYKNQSCEFTWISETKINPSLILDVYPITQKPELLSLIKSQQLYSWCVPIYYGETKNYFIITSPCFINSGSFTEDAHSCINDLHNALKRIIQKKDYDLIGN